MRHANVVIEYNLLKLICICRKVIRIVAQYISNYAESFDNVTFCIEVNKLFEDRYINDSGSGAKCEMLFNFFS